jgi:ribonuclease HI
MKTLSIKDKEIVIFTDGSSRGNPGRGGYGVVAIYPNAHGEMQVDELGGREDLTTNNRMELKAVIEGIKNFVGYYSSTEIREYTFNFYVDSKYVLQGATAWIYGWKKNNWVTAGKEEVKNRDLWEEFDTLVRTHGIRSKWNLIEGHAGIFGNERCDVIATAYADDKNAQKNFKLYTGSLSAYQATEEGKDILNLYAVNQDAKDKLKARKKSGSSAPAYSYISMVDGDIRTHATWKECEARVKGKSKARFKKSASKSDEGSIIASFKSQA